MNNRDFAYWLKGFFELNEEGATPIVLNLAHMVCIENYIEVARQTDIRPSHFISWLRGIIDAVHLAPQVGTDAPVFPRYTKLIREQLDGEINRLGSPAPVIQPRVEPLGETPWVITNRGEAC